MFVQKKKGTGGNTSILLYARLKKTPSAVSLLGGTENYLTGGRHLSEWCIGNGFNLNLENYRNS